MSNLNYTDITIQQSQKKFSLMKEKMLEPVKQVQQARKENLRNLLVKIEKKQNLFQEKRISLEKLCRE
jgi:hypothetical protein